MHTCYDLQYISHPYMAVWFTGEVINIYGLHINLQSHIQMHVISPHCLLLPHTFTGYIFPKKINLYPLIISVSVDFSTHIISSLFAKIFFKSSNKPNMCPPPILGCKHIPFIELAGTHVTICHLWNLQECSLRESVSWCLVTGWIPRP